MDLNEVLDTKAYLSRIREWPSIPEEANPARWLAGFSDDHRDHAVALLDSFIFISARQTKKLFTSAFHALSSELTSGDKTYIGKRDTWRAFLGSVLISAPTGESPNPSDSGYIFQRLARTALRFSEDQVVGINDLRTVIDEGGPRPIILVDDFAGSGNQFFDTWERPMWDTAPRSLDELTATNGLDVYYIPLVCTREAAERINMDASEVHLRPCHVLNDEYAASHPESIVFPEELRATAAEFIRDASDRAGITEDPNGFWDLELAIAFEHSIPDACLGVLWSEEGGWFPLKPKN